ncbi:hypothetical protein SBBP2_100013 [Burkholderiales bacterium]|nr:hypothetical protein SBBP2_100013 [Burkholderiales bacterium]
MLESHAQGFAPWSHIEPIPTCAGNALRAARFAGEQLRRSYGARSAIRSVVVMQLVTRPERARVRILTGTKFPDRRKRPRNKQQLRGRPKNAGFHRAAWRRPLEQGWLFRG